MTYIYHIIYHIYDMYIYILCIIMLLLFVYIYIYLFTYLYRIYTCWPQLFLPFPASSAGSSRALRQLLDLEATVARPRRPVGRRGAPLSGARRHTRSAAVCDISRPRRVAATGKPPQKAPFWRRL